MNLGQKNHTAGNTTRYAVDYSNWLDEGVSLTPASATVVLDPASAAATDVVITAVTITPSNHVVFFLHATVLNETFTLDVQVTDSRGEIKNDTCSFRVVAP